MTADGGTSATEVTAVAAARIARGCAMSWARFAEQIENRGATPYAQSES
jgi:hypothetical protein